MPKLPQVNIRLAPEHHDLIRELAQKLRANPSLAGGLADFIAQADESEPTQVSPLAHGLADEVPELLHAFQERLMIQSNGLRAVEALAENINERLKALEQQAALRGTDGNTDVLQAILDRLAALEARPVGAPQPSKWAPKGPPKFAPRRMPEGRNAILREHVEEAARQWQEGKSYRQIRDGMGLDCNFNALGKKVKQFLEHGHTAGDPEVQTEAGA